MITIRKLRRLKETTRYRKYILILKELEDFLKNGNDINLIYYKELLKEIESEENLASKIRKVTDIDLRSINNLRHRIMSFIGIEPSEWDFTAPSDNLERSNRVKLSMNLYLDDIRSPFNLGSIFRSSECFSVSKIFLSKDTTDPHHPRALRTSMGCTETIDWEVKDLESIKGPFFALELGGIAIDEFKFPKEATVIIGSEELGVSPEALKLADNSLGRVTIPLTGGKSSLNVANATAILLQRWNEALLKS